MITLFIRQFFLIILLPVNLCSQTNNDFIENIKLSVVYHLGIINITAGEISFKSYRINMGANPLTICFEAKGKNLDSYDVFYKYSSSHKAIIDPKTSQLLYFERKVSQKSNSFEEYYSFDHNSNKIYSKISETKKPLKTDTLQIHAKVFDFLTAYLHLRSLKYENMKGGQKVPVNIMLDNKVYPLYIKYLGFERVQLPDNTSYTCYKIVVQVVEGSVFKGGEALTAWITTDSKRLLVQMKAEVLVGSINAYLLKADSQGSIIVSEK